LEPIKADFDLNNRVTVITGAMGKLGGYFSEALLRANGSVAALDLPGCPQSETFLQLKAQYGNRLQAFSANVTDRKSLQDAHQAIRASLGVPAVLVNNAGIDQPPGRLKKTFVLEDIPEEVGRQVLDVNVVGLFLCSQVFLPSLRASGRGSIINIGSLYGNVSPDARLYDHLDCSPPFLKPPMYGASKAAVSSLTRYLATHLGPDDVRVNTLSPGGVLGGQDDSFKKKFIARVPLGRMAAPVDLAGPLVFLASDASRYVTGIELMVDGGFTAW
jgi:NAD(P)-dependent dehydrogenase (short-subunit alcohol dehydrogenase family)